MKSDLESQVEQRDIPAKLLYDLTSVRIDAIDGKLEMLETKIGQLKQLSTEANKIYQAQKDDLKKFIDHLMEIADPKG